MLDATKGFSLDKVPGHDVQKRLAEAIYKDHPEWSAVHIAAEMTRAVVGAGAYAPLLKAFDPDQPRDDSGKWSADPSSDSIVADEAYAYHATTVEHALDIMDAGKLHTHGPSFGTDQSVWPDGSREKRSYWTHDPHVARSFYPEGGKPVLLRVKRTDVALKKESTGDLYERQPVAAEKLEVYTGDGKWRPLIEIKKYNENHDERGLFASGDGGNTISRDDPEVTGGGSGDWVSGAGGTAVYHGTRTPGFTEFNVPSAGQYGMLDRALGVHIAIDPEIAGSFTREGTGAVYPLRIPEGAKFYVIDQPQYEYAIGKPKTNRNVATDEVAINNAVWRVAFQKDPAMFANFMERRWNMLPDQARQAVDHILNNKPYTNTLISGRSETAPIRGLDDYISRDGVISHYDKADREKAVNLFRDDMKAKGYIGIKYTNTSPMETEKAKDPTSFIVFEPKNLVSRIDPSHPMGKRWVEYIAKYNENHDEKGLFASGPGGGGETVTAYHGTRTSVVGKILKEGLTLTNKHNFNEHLYNDERGRSVYVTTKMNEAIEYAELSARDEPALLELSIPKSEFAQFQRDEYDSYGIALRTTKEIPPSWITKASVYVRDSRPDEQIKVTSPAWYDVPLHKVRKDTVKMWVVVDLAEWDEVAKYNENHEPGGSPQGGQFASGDASGGTGGGKTYTREQLITEGRKKLAAAGGAIGYNSDTVYTLASEFRRTEESLQQIEQVANASDFDSAERALNSQTKWQGGWAFAQDEWQAANALGGNRVMSKATKADLSERTIGTRFTDPYKALTPMEVQAFKARQSWMQDAFRKEYGAEVTVYRGVHGAYAKKIAGMGEVDLPSYALSSWTTNQYTAQEFAKKSGRVISTVVKAEDVWLLPRRGVESVIRISDASNEIVVLNKGQTRKVTVL